MQDTTRQQDASHPYDTQHSNNATHPYYTPHPYAEILRAIAEGKLIQFYSRAKSWSDVTHGSALKIIADYVEYSEIQFRIKPETILINGIEVPKPCSSPPAPETIYYIPYFEAEQIDYRFTSLSWDNDSYDLHMLKLGFVHLTKEAAIKHAEAVLSFTSNDVV